MTNWRKTINVAEILHTYEGTLESEINVADRLVTLLQNTGAPLTQIKAAQKRARAGEELFVVEAIFNRGLTEIYDWADRKKIWMGI